MREKSWWGGAWLLALLIVACKADPVRPPESGAEPLDPGLLLLPSGKQFIQVDTWNSHTCALRPDGFVECWGYNGAGEAPLSKGPSGGILTQVTVGVGHSCALQSLGAVECWGVNADDRAPAIKTAANAVFDQVSAGDAHTCARRTDGVIECWGFNEYGEAPPIQAALTGIFTQVASGTNISCATRDDGVVECWGFINVGQTHATVTAASGTFTQVSAGHAHACALRSDGIVQCWGGNVIGEAPATKTATVGVFTQVTARSYHTCGLRSDGVVECWGNNGSGQAPPIRAATTGRFTQVGAGHAHTCAVRDDGVVECWGVNIWGEAPPTRAPVIRVLPIATFTATPASVASGQSFALSLTGATVPGSSGVVTFAYAFDCGDGGGYGPFGTSNSISCLTTSVGSRTVKGIVRDQDGDENEYTGSVNVTFAFAGFTGPVDGPPVVNLVKSGSAIPLNFSLGGDLGLAIFAAGYPASQPIQCDATSPGDPIVETVSAGASSLSYSATTDLYTYVWKTEKSWANTCRKLTLRLIDGSERIALFHFTR